MKFKKLQQVRMCKASQARVCWLTFLLAIRRSLYLFHYCILRKYIVVYFLAPDPHTVFYWLVALIYFPLCYPLTLSFPEQLQKQYSEMQKISENNKSKFEESKEVADGGKKTLRTITKTKTELHEKVRRV